MAAKMKEKTMHALKFIAAIAAFLFVGTVCPTMAYIAFAVVLWKVTE